MLAAQLMSFLFSKPKEDPTIKVDEFLQALSLHDDQMKDVSNLFQAEMKKGLSVKSRAAAVVKMLPTHVCCSPSDSETGQFLALDLGESNFKVQQIQLGDNNFRSRKVEIQEKIFPIQKEQNGRADELFDYISRSLKQFMHEKRIGFGRKQPLALTLAFPCELSALNQGLLLNWTKNVRTSGLQGRDVIHALKASIERTGGMDIDILALVNDSVATMMTGRFDDQECEVGLIIGTGTNACYMEELRHIDLVDGDEGRMCINTEWGAFGDDGSLDKYITEIDKEIDAASNNPGKQIFEKMVSSMYLGELVRVAILKMAKQGLLFKGSVPNSLKTKGRITLTHVAAIENSQGDLQNIRDILLELDITPSVEDCIAVQRVSTIVSSRSSSLVAACLSAILCRIKQNKRSTRITVAVDGELYKKHPQYSKRLQRAVQGLIPEVCARFSTSPCGTGTGAALITVAAKQMAWKRQQVHDTVCLFKLSEEQLNLVKSRMRTRLEMGLAQQQEPQMKMLSSYVYHVPSGKESGLYLALVLEETHFRAALVNIRNGHLHHTNLHHKIYELPRGLTHINGEEFFAYVARCISDFLDFVNMKNACLPAALTVSSSYKQTAIDKSTLLKWTKGVEATDCEGQDIVTMLREAIERHATFDLDIVAIVSDAVGTMMALAYDNPQCEVGLIVGSGVNVCYMEDLKNIAVDDPIENKLAGGACAGAEGGTGKQRICINTECGQLGDDGSLEDVITPYDVQVDLDSRQSGKQRFEKLTSGLYQGEVIRQVLLDLTGRGLLFKGHENRALKTPGLFHINCLSQIESGRAGVLQVRSILQNLGLGSNCDDSTTVKEVCCAVSRRAAQLCAAVVAAAVDKRRQNRGLERLNISVAVDGELYKLHPHFSRILKETTKSLAPQCTVTFLASEEGSGKGAVLIAAAAAARKKHIEHTSNSKKPQNNICKKLRATVILNRFV